MDLEDILLASFVLYLHFRVVWNIFFAVVEEIAAFLLLGVRFSLGQLFVCMNTLYYLGSAAHAADNGNYGSHNKNHCSHDNTDDEADVGSGILGRISQGLIDRRESDYSTESNVAKTSLD